MRISDFGLRLAVGMVLATAAVARAEEAAQTFFNVETYGAKADGSTKCTDAIRSAIDAASKRGGGTVYFPAGTYLTGPIHLKSNITLFVDAGAVVKFSNDFDDYLPMVASRWEGIRVQNFSPLIYANGAENISIVGRGTLDGQGKAWWETYRSLRKPGNKERNHYQVEFAKLNAAIIEEMKYPLLDFGFLRPPFIQPYECKNVLVEGVTIRNSPFWTVTPVFCDGVQVRGVTIENPEESPNTDGINPDSCRNVHIADCNITVGDDCITIKSGRDSDGRKAARPIENVTITNCTMQFGHGGVVIGSEMSGGVKNVTISNCVFNGTDRGIRLKSTRGRGGVVECLRVSNVVMRNIREEAVLITSHYTKTDVEPVSERTPIFRDIHISGLTGDAKKACEIEGLEEAPVSNVTLTDLRLKTKEGVTIEHAKDIELHNLTLDVKDGPLVKAAEAEGVELDHVRSHDASKQLLELSKVKGARVDGKDVSE